MTRRLWNSGRVVCGLATAGLALGLIVAAPAVAAAKGDKGHGHGKQVCTGTFASPGVLSGTYSGNVFVEGVCVVNAGPAVVNGNLFVGKNAAVGASFGLNDTTGTGSSSLTVDGNVLVQKNGTLFLGCDPQSSPCLDDPNQQSPTLSSPGSIGGDLHAEHALGVVVHNTTIGGSYRQDGGGGGFNCTPTGIFADIKSPVFSALEDSTVSGSVSLRNVTSCWAGINRVKVAGSVDVQKNRMADPDAIEIESNTISGNLSCAKNTAVWDSGEVNQNSLFPRTPHPNTVNGKRSGQCVLSSPTAPGGPSGPGPF